MPRQLATCSLAATRVLLRILALTLLALTTQVLSEATESESRSVDLERLREALGKAISEPGGATDLHLLTECHGPAGARSLEIFQSGVAIWNGSRQFRLSRAEMTETLSRLREAGFVDFLPSYGGGPPSDPGAPDDEPSSSAQVILCQIDLRLAGARGRSQQLARGETFLPLSELAESLLDRFEDRGEAGWTADSLGDGLAKILRGDLAPEVLTVQLRRRSDTPVGQRPRRDFLLTLQGATAQARSRSRDGALAEPVVSVLEPDSLQRLLESLAAAEPDSLPANLWADDLVDLTLRLLDRQRSVQARRFGRLTPRTHGSRQQDFDRLVEDLTDLYLSIVEPTDDITDSP